MGVPKKIKKHIPLIEERTLYPRREELVDKINHKGTFLPKSILHEDMDRGFLDFIKNEVTTTVDGKLIPVVDVIVTTQNWSQFVETWDIQNLDKNIEPPFITTIRIPEVKYGTNPAVLYTIPNRRLYFYAQVPTWDGQRNGVDIYKIPQPVPVDITYHVKIVANRMRELNEFNKTILEKFSSRQSYATINGHYIPIIHNGTTDESVFDIEKRKFYIQSYEFIMLGFLIDENQFEVSPAITREFTIFETDLKTRKRNPSNETIESSPDYIINYEVGVDDKTITIDYTADFILDNKINIDSFDVFINGDYYGSDLEKLQLNTNDVLKVEIIKTDINKLSSLNFKVNLL